MYFKLFSISICMFLLSASSFSQDGITVTMSASIKIGLASYHNGIQFTLRNVESKLLYHSNTIKKAPTLTKHAIIEDLPKGKYEMFFIGPHDYARRDSTVAQFFGLLDFTKHEGYYLGCFKGKISAGYNKPCYLKLVSTEVPKRVIKICRKRGYLIGDQELYSNFTYLSSDLVLQPLRNQ